MSVSVQKIVDPVVLGEGPHWDDKQQALYFVDINMKTINKYVPTTGEHTKTTLDGRVGFILPVDGTDDQFVVGVERKFLVIQWDGKDGSTVKVVKELGEVDQDVPTTRINDGKADPKGRLFAGTMGCEDPPGNFDMEKGSLFRVDRRGIVKMCSGISISNGLAWDLREKAMYYNDSLESKIRRYDYDVDTGDISNLKYVFDLKKNNIDGLADGMTIDTDGNIWVAIFNGSCVLKIDPKAGTVLQRVPIPAKQVTSVTFGGPNLDVLFVTTASMFITEEQKPPCGSTFMVFGLGVKGHPNVNFKLP
ncbi:PREDICTED: regucalcin-like [Papilio polytes]|uniref:regucalcin-like n=1 Tax=Papilio polytes TaxID=76194 RepID=UPI00067668E3|nr:PREDICTED: regucalcin-like [Papilio polytes]